MITIEHNKNNPNKMHLICDSNQMLSVIRENLSVPNPASKSQKNPFIPKRLYAITPTGQFDSGLLKTILEILDQCSIEYKLSDKIKNELISFTPEMELDELTLPYRDYQKNAILSAIGNKNGIFLIGTGGGKTLLTAGIIKNLQKYFKKPFKTIIIVPTIQLIQQTYTDFIEYGLTNVSKLSGKNQIDLNWDVLIIGSSYLTSKNTDLSILSQADIFICDECHIIKKSNKLSKIFKYVKAPYKFGLTGTMPEDDIDKWNVIGKIGPIIYTKKTKSLLDDQYLTPFQICILNISHEKFKFSYDKNSPTSSYIKEIEYLLASEKRNDIIKKLCLKLKTNTIIMVDRIEHGEKLFNLLTNGNDRKVFFIQGSTDIEERERIRKLMENNNEIIIIAIAKIFSTGINIPNLRNIIFASAGKAKVKIIQSIGRSLRLFPTKEKAYIFDIADNTYYSSIHKKARQLLYDGEEYEYIEKKL
jgi:superfamily II DNA or RNA helicase